MTDITAKLNRLAELQSQQDVINLRFDELRNSVLTPDIRAELDEIEAERQTALDTLSGGITALTDEIKADVLAGGQSVKGAHLMAVWAKGRVSWDTKKLDGLMIALPQLAAARSEGQPSVSIRKV